MPARTNLTEVIETMKSDQPELTFNEQYAARKTWKALSEFTNIPQRTLIRRRRELMDCGAIFYVRRPNRHVHGSKPTVCFFPAVIMAWFILKAAKGEVF